MREEVKLKLLLNYLDELTKNYTELFHQKEKLLKELQKEAMHDSLTGLYNRNALFSFLERESEKIKREGGKLLVAFLDLDNFKSINDTYGHKKGDEVLKEVGNLLKNSFRKYDVVARFGGDEFILAVTLSQYVDKEEIEKILRRIEKKIEKIFKDFNLSISYGTAVMPEDAEDIQNLIKLADKRMYKMKQKKKQAA